MTYYVSYTWLINFKVMLASIDDFIENIASQACVVTAARKSNILEAKDVQFVLGSLDFKKCFVLIPWKLPFILSLRVKIIYQFILYCRRKVLWNFRARLWKRRLQVHKEACHLRVPQTGDCVIIDQFDFHHYHEHLSQSLWCTFLIPAFVSSYHHHVTSPNVLKK